MIKSLSVFFPAFNEEKNIQKTVENAVAVLKKLEIPWEILIVDDGSSDTTGLLADELAGKYPNIKVTHQENGGYGLAMRTGLHNAKYEWIVYTDADGQFDFSEVVNFFPLCCQSDAIWGFRKERRDPFYRSLFSYIWGSSVKLLTGVFLKDINCGFKMFKKTAIDKIKPLKSTRGAMINPELAVKLKKFKFKILEVGVNHYPRTAGIPTGASLKVIIRSYLELFLLWSKNY